MQNKKLTYSQTDSGKIYLWTLALAILIPSFISLILIISNAPVDENNNFLIIKETWFLVLYRLLIAGSFVLIFFLFNKSKNISPYACGIKEKPHYLSIVFAILLSVGLLYLLNPIITLYSNELNKLGLFVGEDLSINSTLDLFLNLAVLALLPAITEELLFRGMIFQGLRGLGKWPAILLSSGAFSLMHTNLAQFPYTFILGIALGFLMWETRSLWLCMLMHFVNNAAVLITTFAEGGSEDISSAAANINVFLAIGLMFAAGLLTWLVFFLINKVEKKNKKQELVFEKEPKKSLVWLFSGFAVAVLITILNILKF